MEIAKAILEYTRVLAWPFLALLAACLFTREIRALLQGLAGLLDRIKTVAWGEFRVEVAERLARGQRARLSVEAGREGQHGKPLPELELLAPTGAYSRDYRAIFVVASIVNRTERADQVLTWRLGLPSISLDLEPNPAPPQLVSSVPFWSDPYVQASADKNTQGQLFFRSRGALQQGLPEEPLRGHLTATTLHGRKLACEVKVYRLTTLQENPSLGADGA